VETSVVSRFLKPLLKRRQLIVSGVQYRLMVGNFLYLVAVVLIFVATIFVPLLSSTGGKEAAQQMLALHGQLWIGVPVILLLCLAHSLVVSHRIAGPLYRLSQILRALAGGDLTPSVRIRRGDYLWDEARVLDEMVGALARKVGAIRETYHEAQATLPRLVEAISRHDREDSVVLTGKLTAQLDFLGREIAAFKLPPRQGEPSRAPIAAVPHEVRDAPTSLTPA
jgi:hypothetical protein